MSLCFLRGRGANRTLVVASLALASPATAQQTNPSLDPASPLSAMPDLGVAWPDLNVRDPIEADPSASKGVQANDERRYRLSLEGVSALSVVQSRFDILSVLREGEGKTANAAQINRRVREDAELLDTILRAEGYYDADIDQQVSTDPQSGEVSITLKVEPGTLYRFSDVALPGLDAAGSKVDELRNAYGLGPQTPVNADTVISGESRLRLQLGREGYPFAKVAEPDIVVNHATNAATLSMAVDPGGQRRFGAIKLDGGNPPFSAKHVQVIGRFRPDELYNQDLVDDLQRALIATGLVSQARVVPVEGAKTGTVDMATTIDPAPTHTIAGEAGFSTGEGYRLELSWQDRNLLRPEGAVTVRGVAGTQQQLFGVNLRMGNFRRRDQVLNGSVLVNHDDRAAYDAYTVQIAGSIERRSTFIFQRPWTYSVGGELVASDERDVDATTGRRQFFIVALPGMLGYDGSDSLLDPTRGFRLSGRFSPELSLEGTAFGYVRTQIDASIYKPVAGRTSIAGRIRLGVTTGAARQNIAPSRLYYAGGGGSIRGFSYQRVGPLNSLDEPIGGRSLAEFSLEARVRLPVFGGNFGVVPFIDAGNVYTGSLPSFTGMRIGVGAGVRYYTSFGPIRVDVGTPLARRPGESLIAVYVSLGQSF